jgi:YHS domain-containing protein
LPIGPDAVQSPKATAPNILRENPSPGAKETLRPTEAKPTEKAKPAEDTKPAAPAKPTETPKPAGTETSPPRAQDNRIEQNTTTMASPLKSPDTPQLSSMVVPLAGERVEWNPIRSTTNHADAIVATQPETPTRGIEVAAYTTVESEAGSSPIATPPVALNGYCPVDLIRNGCWTQGDLRWTVVYKGAIYRLAGPSQREQFLAHPEAFVAMYSGNDPVLTVEEHRTVAGQAIHCATYNDRLYMFSSSTTQEQFNKDPQRYAVQK